MGASRRERHGRDIFVGGAAMGRALISVSMTMNRLGLLVGTALCVMLASDHAHADCGSTASYELTTLTPAAGTALEGWELTLRSLPEGASLFIRPELQPGSGSPSIEVDLETVEVMP